MTGSGIKSSFFASLLVLCVPSMAGAEDKQKTDQTTAKPEAAKRDGAMPKPAKPDAKPTAKQHAATQRTSAEVMRITQQALAHIGEAVTALDKGNSTAAKKALEQASQVIEPLYDTPLMVAILNELDEAIASVQNKQQTLKALDLAPLAASVATYRTWVDPSVATRIDEAKAGVKKGDAKATMEALRLARNRMAIDLAFLPVEEAYLRISAAQHALDEGEAKRAKHLLQTLPIVVSEVSISTPLVPVRFKLNAAAMAAEEGNWTRSQTLLREATKEMRDVEKLLKGKPIGADASALVDDLEKLDREIDAKDHPQPREIRELAKRTRDLGV